MTKTLNVALIGVSGIAETYAGILQHIPEFNLTHVHSRDDKRAQSFQNKFNLPHRSTDLNTLCENKDIDAFIICNEPQRHVATAIQGLKQKKHLLIEKPLSHDLKSALDLES